MCACVCLCVCVQACLVCMCVAGGGGGRCGPRSWAGVIPHRGGEGGGGSAELLRGVWVGGPCCLVWM